MNATIHKFDEHRSNAANARRIAEHLIIAAEAMKPDTEAAIGGMITAAFEIACRTSQPGLRRRTSHTLRSIAALIDQIEATEQGLN